MTVTIFQLKILVSFLTFLEIRFLDLSYDISYTKVIIIDITIVTSLLIGLSCKINQQVFLMGEYSTSLIS